jgi:glycine cleavage system H protein
MNMPEPAIRFTREHEWVAMRNGIATIGISDFAQNQLGEIVSIELPKVGSTFKVMQAMAIVDSVKASSDIFSPLSGMVSEINENLLEHPELINQSPYESGWMLKLKPSQQSELDSLMTKEEYDRFVGEERDKEDKEREVANKPSQADQD